MKILKNTLFVIVISVMMAACTVKESEETIQLKAADVQLTTDLEMYESVWDKIINERNIDAINETSFDKEVIIVTVPENIVGIQSFKDYYQNYLTGFSDAKFTIVDVFGQGDKIVKHWNFKGTYNGDFFGIPATGKVVVIDGVTLVQLKNGKIAQERDFLDNLELMQQLGIMER